MDDVVGYAATWNLDLSKIEKAIERHSLEPKWLPGLKIGSPNGKEVAVDFIYWILSDPLSHKITFAT